MRTGIPRIAPIPIRYDSGEGLIKIEKDLASLHSTYAELLIERYKKEERKHFTRNEEENVRIGIIGQRAFHSVLNHWRVPCIYEDPAYEWLAHRTFYDFVIPAAFGKTIKLEVKTFQTYAKFFIVKKSEWDNLVCPPDYTIALRYLSDSELKVEGWLPGFEVKSLPPVPQHICPYAPCYGCRIEMLKPWRELEPLLKGSAIKV